MPSSAAILASASSIANDYAALAILWHAAVAGFAALLLVGWRPAQRTAGLSLAAPLLSVGALAGISGNPFNATVFGGLAVTFVLIARGLPNAPVRIARGWWLAIGVALVAFGCVYPHFLDAKSWIDYLVAAPVGVVPCPSLAAILGFTLILGLSRSTRWSYTIAAAALVYGVIGILRLGVNLDVALIAGAVAVLVACRLGGACRSVRADEGEHERVLPGDERIAEPIGVLTHGITIRRPRSEVWPWIVQMGAGSRAGWYSYDLLDNGRRRSAMRIVPELQRVDPGMIFPAVPGAKDGFTLLAFEPRRWLLLGWLSPDATPVVTWVFVLDERPDGSTRLITRARAGAAYRVAWLPRAISKPVIRVVHFIMERKQLLGIATRAEQTASVPTPSERAA